MKWLIRQSILWHRYLGIAFCLFFGFWYVSGIVMMYAQMPELTELERLAHLPQLDFSRAKFTPREALGKHGLRGEPIRITVGMLGERPVYRFLPSEGKWVTVFADTGEVLRQLDPATAIQIALPYQEKPGTAMRVVRELRDVDQWTVNPASRPFLPFLLLETGDDKGTEYYISAATGSIYLRTTRLSKLLAWCGAIPHWWYIRSLRANDPLWQAVMITVSAWGIVMSLAGILTAILRFSPSRRYRLPHGHKSYIPYVGWKRWHYYFSLGFGLATFTWILSGLLTMNPGHWSPGPNPTQAEIQAFAGAELDPNVFHVAPPQATSLLRRCLDAVELEMLVFQGRPYYLATDRQSQSRLLSGLGDSESCISEMPTQELIDAASRVAGMVHAADSVLLTSYDHYYYDRNNRKPLPVLRVRFADARQTWLYINPQTTLIQARYTNRSRYERWLYEGLHDLDFPFLYWHRPAWDLTVIGLSVGGIALIISSIVLAVKYLQKSARRNFRAIPTLTTKNKDPGTSHQPSASNA
jgi:hypothetical protein